MNRSITKLVVVVSTGVSLMCSDPDHSQYCRPQHSLVLLHSHQNSEEMHEGLGETLYLQACRCCHRRVFTLMYLIQIILNIVGSRSFSVFVIKETLFHSGFQFLEGTQGGCSAKWLEFDRRCSFLFFGLPTSPSLCLAVNQPSRERLSEANFLFFGRQCTSPSAPN